MTDRFNSPAVYCHNDLLSGNLMLNEDTGNLSCIALQNLINYVSLHMDVFEESLGCISDC